MSDVTPPSPEPEKGPAGPLGPEQMRRAFLTMTLAFYGVGFAISLAGALLADHPLEYLPGSWENRSTWATAGTLLVVGAGAGLLVVVAGHFASGVFPSLDALEREFASYLDWMRGWFDAFLIAGASALGEEAFFRGLLQPWLGLFWTSALFAACHPPLNARLILWPVFALAMGLLLGWLFDRSGGNLLAPTMVHFVVNFVNLKLIARRAGSKVES